MNPPLLKSKSRYLYTPYYCEENIWQLAAAVKEVQCKVVFISNINRQCALWHQRAAAPGSPIIWDYHVILLCLENGQWTVYDFDTTLNWGASLTSYLSQTFDPSIPQEFQPRFRVIATHIFLSEFSSDRRHMQSKNGDWLQPIPNWPAIKTESVHNLDQFIDMDQDSFGEVVDLEAMRRLSTN